MTDRLRIWTMPTAGLTEADATGWLPLLDDGERNRAARFVFERHRTTFIAAHALARCVLSRVDPSQPPEAWRFIPGEHGKPVAWAPVACVPVACDPGTSHAAASRAASSTVASHPASATAGTGSALPSGTSTPGTSPSGTSPSATLSPGISPSGTLPFGAGINYEPARLTFNLSHTDGLVGLATLSVPGRRLGFDVEPADRSVNLDVADRFFRSEETTWLRSLPEAGRPEGFLRLWTLKEAFIKATGEGLVRDLASFWFRVPEATISFIPAADAATAGASPPEGSPEQAVDQPAEWQFEQRVVAGAFLAAVGLHRPAGSHQPATWINVEPDMLRNHGAGLPAG